MEVVVRLHSVHHRGMSGHTLLSGDHARERTAIACEVYVLTSVFDSRSKRYIWPVSEASAIRLPSGLCVDSRLNVTIDGVTE